MKENEPKYKIPQFWREIMYMILSAILAALLAHFSPTTAQNFLEQTGQHIATTAGVIGASLKGVHAFTKLI